MQAGGVRPADDLTVDSLSCACERHAIDTAPRSRAERVELSTV
jgi:hypothetical protein